MHYYKTQDGNAYMAYKTPHLSDEFVEITEEEWNEHFATATPEPSESELAKQEKESRIAKLKSELAKTDYEAIKYAEGVMSEEEYAPIKAQRQAWRAEINSLEEELGSNLTEEA